METLQHEPFKLNACHHIRMKTITVVSEQFWIDQIVACADYYTANFKVNELLFLLEVYGPAFAEFLANAANSSGEI